MITLVIIICSTIVIINYVYNTIMNKCYCYIVIVEYYNMCYGIILY